MKYKFAFVILLMAWLVACGEQITPIASATIEPSEALFLTKTSTLILLPTTTLTPLPSNTLMFTPAASQTEILFEPDPFPTLTPNPTALVLEKKWNSYSVIISPDGQWGAGNKNNFAAAIEVTNLNTYKTWTIPCDLFSYCSDIEILHWTRDSRYVYIVSKYWVGETSFGQPIYTGLGRIDVQSGKWEKIIDNKAIIADSNTPAFPDATFDFSISPDDLYLAYTKATNENKFEFGILSTDNFAENEKLTLDGNMAGDILWSPSSDHLVFLAVDWSKGHSMVYYDLNARLLRYIINNDPKNDYGLLGWDSKLNLVMVMKIDWGSSGRTTSYLYLNPFTGELTSASSISQP